MLYADRARAGTQPVSGPRERMNRDTPPSQAAKASFLAQRDELGRVLGLSTVDLLIDRGVTEIGEAFPSLRAIEIDNGELRVDSLDEAFLYLTGEEAWAALNALTAVMLLVLGRLLGRRVAQSLAESINR